MNEPGGSSPLRAVLRDIGRNAAASLENGQYARKTTLLLLTPPLVGVLLAGVLVSIPRALREPASADAHVTLGMGVASTLLLGGLLVQSLRVRRGSPSEFPRLWRLLPYTALAGLIFGLALAWRHARGG